MQFSAKITFGKYKGQEWKSLPISYLKWLASQEIRHGSYNWSEMARQYVQERGWNAYISADEKEALQREEEIQRHEDDEARAEYEATHTIEWTAGSGQHIVIRCEFDVWSMQHYYEISVEGSPGKKAYEIINLSKSPAPGIVAKIGNIGLTAERRDALLAMTK